MGNYERLFSPMRVGCTVWKNRIETGPMSIVELDAKEGLTEQAIAFYESLAAGGAAMVTIGESIVPTRCGKTHPQQIMLGRDAVRFSLKKVTDAIHAHGALANIEINHGGAMADPAYNQGNPCIGPVSFTDQWGDSVTGMDEAMMDQVAEAFAAAALTCQECGFDMVMIHCGHGWLLNQFLSPKFNTRQDAYGGDITGRARFPLMVIDRVRQKVGRRMPIEIRVSGSEFCEGGLEIGDVVQFCKMCEDRVDLINVSAGAPWTKRMALSMFEPRGMNAEFSKAIKEAVTRIPVIVVGGYADPDLMERQLEEHLADGFVLGRSILADPQLPQKARTGREKEIHRCLRCYVCNESQYYGCRTLMCSINPIAGRENEAYRFPHDVPRRKVAVIGGGPAGMEAALTAAKAGHDVTLYEKSSQLGGWLRLEQHVPFKRDLWHLAQTLAYECSLAQVTLRLNTRVTKELLEQEKPDTVICAIGSDIFIPNIQGCDLPNVLRIDQLPFPVKKDLGIVVIGGGLVGTELGLHLAMEGCRVTILEMKEDLAMDATHDHRRFLMPQLEQYHVHAVCKAKAAKIQPDGVWAQTPDSPEPVFFPSDYVVLAAGLIPREAEAERLRSSEYDFVRIGDCSRVRNVCSAIREGFDAATFMRT